MAESLNITGNTSRQRYESFVPQLCALLSGEGNRMGVLANAAAALRQAFHFFWVGFYLTEGFLCDKGWLVEPTVRQPVSPSAVPFGEGALPGDRLLLGPFQGDIACFSIHKGHGVCGAAWAEERTIVVPDVEAFPGHIACSSLSRSEIVVPLFDASHNIVGVLDVDSDKLNDFSPDDKWGLEQCAAIVAEALVG
ncbi:MAG: GAF domain-containing protein [Bacteroidales bacterium]|nr:GAF domain-containing protein [Bacteroidales bacterium]